MFVLDREYVFLIFLKRVKLAFVGVSLSFIQTYCFWFKVETIICEGGVMRAIG